MNIITKITHTAIVFGISLEGRELFAQTTGTWCLNGTSTDSNICAKSIFTKLILDCAIK